jgi:hypothetical protein
MATATFAAIGVHLPEDQDPLGIWSLVPSGVQAFAAAPSVDPLWRVDVSVADSEAASLLQSKLEFVEEWRSKLRTIEAQISELTVAAGYEVAVAAPGAAAALLSEVQSLRGYALAYELDPDAMAPLGPIYEECERLLEEFRGLLKHWGRIETRVSGRSVGLTAVDWTGDFQTSWLEGIGQSDMALHLDAVKLAIASRLSLVQLVIVVATGALELALKASVPGGQVLLLPAVYRYVKDVLAELEGLRVS